MLSRQQNTGSRAEWSRYALRDASKLGACAPSESVGEGPGRGAPLPHKRARRAPSAMRGKSLLWCLLAGFLDEKFNHEGGALWAMGATNAGTWYTCA